jgi:hypothetical protein
MLNKVKNILLPIFIGTLLIFLVYDKIQQKSDKQETSRINSTKTEKAKNELIDKIISKYNALPDWDKEIREKTSNIDQSYFTIDLQKAVEKTDKKPVALKLIVEDIYKNKDKVIVRFREQKIRSVRNPILQYELKCNEELVGKIIRVADKMNRMQFLRKKLFIVIASLTNVNMHKLEISSDEMSGDIYSSDLEIPHSISGKCIDLEPIGPF